MLLPTPAPSVDAAALYTAGPRRPVGGRPWVLANMISTVDGSSTDTHGRSGGLGSEADRDVLIAVRAVADIVIAGAGTVRAENYGPARVPADLQAQRAARGQAPRPRIAVVSASLRLEPTMRLFQESSDERPLIVTVDSADADARRRLEPVADMIVAGDERVDWHRALTALRQDAGAGVVVVEGGPIVNGQLVADDLVDELCLTLAPALAGGDAARVVHGAIPDASRPLRLAHALEADGYLLLRYLVDHPSGAS
jgi:riboflavin-specific deaminase-like protein